jgi:hypothetical protein
VVCAAVFFVEDIGRAIEFHDRLGFEKAWHEADGKGTVCQVQRGGCELILCEDTSRNDRGRLFVELMPDGFVELRSDIERNSIASKATWWGYDVISVLDPDGNELLFPYE